MSVGFCMDANVFILMQVDICIFVFDVMFTNGEQ